MLRPDSHVLLSPEFEAHCFARRTAALSPAIGCRQAVSPSAKKSPGNADLTFNCCMLRPDPNVQLRPDPNVQCSVFDPNVQCSAMFSTSVRISLQGPHGWIQSSAIAFSKPPNFVADALMILDKRTDQP